MPADIKDVVQRMIDAGETEENIASVIKEYNHRYPTVRMEVLRSTPITEPTTFGEGFKKSIMSGEALDAGLQGLKGYAQGAIADLPASMMGALGTIGGMISYPRQTMSDVWQGLKTIPQTTMMAGGQPEEFGRMMGQITGQPLVTAGIAKNIPAIRAGIGMPIEAAGHVMGESQPLSGIMPRFARMRTLKLLEKELGPKVEKYGGMISGKPPKSGIPGTSRGTMMNIGPESTIQYNTPPDRLTELALNPPETNYYEGSRGYSVNQPQTMTVNPLPTQLEQLMKGSFAEPYQDPSDLPYIGLERSSTPYVPSQQTPIIGKDVAHPTGIDWARIRALFKP